MTRKSFNRRAFLRSTGGTLIALPFAQFASNGEKLIGAPAGDAPVRLFTLSWGTGAPPELFNFDDVLKSLAPLQRQMVLIQNMSHPGVSEPQRRGIAPHVAGGLGAFTGTSSKSQDGSNSNKKEIPTTASIDQIAYEAFKPTTKLPLIQTGYSGFVDQAGSGDFLDYRSFDAKGKHLDEIMNDPYKLFTAFFGTAGTGTPASDAAAIATKIRRQSVLDGAVNQIKELNSDRYGLSAESRAQLNIHLEKLRELEMASANSSMATCKIPGSITKEQGLRFGRNTNTLKEMMDLISSLLVVGLQCDLVRYGNICIGESAFHCRIDSLLDGSSTDGHEAAHTAALVPIWVAFVKYYIETIAAMMSKLQAAADTDGKTLLDNTIIYAATEMSDHSKGHSFADMPAMIFGGKPHAVPSGTIIDAKQRPIADALAGCLTAAGVPTDKLGPFGTGRLF